MMRVFTCPSAFGCLLHNGDGRWNGINAGLEMADQTTGLENGSGERQTEGLSPDPFSSPAVWSAIFQSGIMHSVFAT